jgi:beta-barrel assembly-enhancing protease
MKKILLLLSFFLACSSGRKTGTLNFVTLDEEIALGREITIQTPQVMRTIRNQEIMAFFNQLAKELAAASDWTGLGYSVFIINDPASNHFSLPGGQIYLYRGLVEKTENAAELAAVIAHEIAHIGRRDAVNRLAVKYSYSFAAQSVIGQNPELANQLLHALFTTGTILDYPKKAEFAADASAIKFMWKANFNPLAIETLVQKLRLQEKEDTPGIALLRRTHPAALDRLRHIRKELTDVPTHSGLRQDLADYKKIRDQLSRIPQ